MHPLLLEPWRHEAGEGARAGAAAAQGETGRGGRTGTRLPLMGAPRWRRPHPPCIVAPAYSRATPPPRAARARRAALAQPGPRRRGLRELADRRALLAAISRFRARVDAALPGAYAWFSDASLHVTLRALIN